MIYIECDMCAKRFDYYDEKLSVVTFTNSEGYKDSEFDLCPECYKEIRKQIVERRKEMHEKNRQNVYIE